MQTVTMTNRARERLLSFLEHALQETSWLHEKVVETVSRSELWYLHELRDKLTPTERTP